MINIKELTVKEISQMLDNGETTPEELVEACIEATETFNPSVNAYITFCPEEARRQAAIEGEYIRKHGRKSRVHGIPFAVKDLMFVKGVTCTAGSEQMRDFVPDFDTTSVRRLKEAGAIFMGKTNTQEWGCGPTGDRSFFGPARNPYNTELITGGSSSGSAAAVAAGMVPMALGTDAGGSIRIPASLCGIAGFKTSNGVIKEDGQLRGSLNLGVSGPMAKTAGDMAIMMDIISGGDRHFVKTLDNENTLKGKRFVIPRGFFDNSIIEGVKKVFDEVIGKISAAGAVIDYADISWFDEIAAFSSAITFPEIAYLHRERLKEKPDAYTPYIRERIEKGFTYSATEYIAAMEKRREAILRWEELMSDKDALIMPTTPVTAYPLFTKEVEICGMMEDGATMLVRHTRAANVLGCPAVSVNAGFSEGLPVGVMLMGKTGSDAMLLSLGSLIEKM
ncbi:MAG: amidase [Eubacteriales bacterium]|nr:amidase [Eubacteriales bacterium]